MPLRLKTPKHREILALALSKGAESQEAQEHVNVSSLALYAYPILEQPEILAEADRRLGAVLL
jgi:hypothetical protein